MKTRSQPPCSAEPSSEKSLPEASQHTQTASQIVFHRDQWVGNEEAIDRRRLKELSTNFSHVGALTTRGLTLVRTRDSGKDPGPPPDGGFKAWSQVALAHFVIFNTWGYINSFGVFQDYYTQTLGRPPSDISWVGSVQIFLLFFIGTLSGRATDAGYFKAILTCGAILELVCIFMTSLCTQYWQLFLAQGIGQGIGCGLMFCPTIALMPTYFTKNRAIAIGITASGSATGGLVFPAVVMRLLPRIGYGWTVRTLGFISLATLTPCLIFLQQRLPPRRSGPLVELAAFREPSYALFALGMFLNFWGLYVGFFYISSFAQDIIGVSQSTSIDVLLVMNGVGLMGRLIPNLLADRFTGPLNMLIPFSLVTGVVAFCWTSVESYNGLYAFSAFYGLAAAGIQSLFPATLSTLTTDLKKTGVRMGMVLSVVAVAALIGTPIAGALVVRDSGQYLYAQMFMGSAILAGTLTLVVARTSKIGLIYSRGGHTYITYHTKSSVTRARTHTHTQTHTQTNAYTYALSLPPFLNLIMAPRGRGKFSKPSRGGGKHFSRDVQPVDKDGNPVGLWRDPEENNLSVSEEEESSESGSEESSDNDDNTAHSPRAGSSSMPAASGSSSGTTEMTREERRAAAKAKKQAAQARRMQSAAQPGDLPPSDTEGSGNDSDDEDLPANPNHTAKSRSQLSSTQEDAQKPDGDLSQLSRREREAIEAHQARQRYLKLHAEGKTEEARSDLARLALVREQREADRLRKEAEKEEKAELAKQRAAERETKLQGAKGGKKKAAPKRK
ncbi:putative MFS monocarboxylate transporter [Aspergillus saccharolyticus JOP 1030-1]|uniref:MFS general substrate transporter n=1 Tax=Aspergillus saccharolyticus JOP 1030-1 TaxID=1450539 RepID=A0A318Z3X5_9EURO|nr:MFS general substrate transporter [Aspergillus saccharolyticus JOP 1030-1]PYH41124.1 MFS general substrate transporter [Aspergillus saccharolyticus JOP 1030-1]